MHTLHENKLPKLGSKRLLLQVTQETESPLQTTEGWGIENPLPPVIANISCQKLEDRISTYTWTTAS